MYRSAKWLSSRVRVYNSEICDVRNVFPFLGAKHHQNSQGVCKVYKVLEGSLFPQKLQSHLLSEKFIDLTIEFYIGHVLDENRMDLSTSNCNCFLILEFISNFFLDCKLLFYFWQKSNVAKKKRFKRVLHHSILGKILVS